MNNIILVVLCFLSCNFAFASNNPLLVVSYSPSGQTKDKLAYSAITVTFNQQVIPLSSSDDMSDFCPVEIKPAVKGRCHWQGSYVVSFEPELPLENASSFEVRIPKGMSSRISGEILENDFVWNFETIRPELLITSPVDGERWVDINPKILAVFNMDMEPSRAVKYIKLFESDLNGSKPHEIPVAVTRAVQKDINERYYNGRYYYWDDNSYNSINLSSNNVFNIKPLLSLKKDRAYRLEFGDGLLARNGDLGILGDRRINFETYYSFKIVEHPAKSCLPHRFEIGFTNPVFINDLYDHLIVEPAIDIPKLSGYYSSYTGSKDHNLRRVRLFLPDVNYKPDTLYKFKIKKGLMDIFGNTIDRDEDFILETDMYCPKWSMPTGFGTLESYLPPRHPVTAMNAFNLPLVKARIDENDFINFYNTIWQDRESLPPNYIKKNWDLSSKRNSGLKTFIDFKDLFGDKRGGIAFAQLPSANSSVIDDEGIRASNSYYPLRALDNITSIGLTVKSSPDDTFIWTTFLKDAKPAKNIYVEIRDNNNKILWQGKSDKNGFVDAPGWKYLGIKDWQRYERPRLWVFAYHKDGTAIMSNEVSWEMMPWRFNISYDPYPKPYNYKGFMFSERGVYRPSESVFIKGFVRRLENGDWADSDIRTLKLIIKNSRGDEVLKTTVTLSEFSSFNYEYHLPPESATGLWSVEVSDVVDDEKKDVVMAAVNNEKEKKIEIYNNFRVEEFKPASFEVKLNPKSNYYISGSTYSAMVDGWYLFGEPMVDCDYEWKAIAARSYYEISGYDGFNFSPGWWNDNYSSDINLLSSGSGKLDRNGRAGISFAIDRSRFKLPSTILTEVSVLSPEKQRLFSRSSVFVHPASFYIGIKPSSTFIKTDETWAADIITVTPDGKKVDPKNLKAEIKKREWMSVKRAGVGGRLEWISQRNDTLISSFTFVSEDTFTYKTSFSSPGLYLFSVSGTDEEKRETETGISFYVTGTGSIYWEEQNKDIIELVADKKSYNIGDTARILVKSPYDTARALVSVEREKMIDRWTEVIKGQSTTIEVPIKEGYLPNVYVSVILIRPRIDGEKYDSNTGDDLAKPQSKFGYVNLAVSPVKRKLDIKIKTDKDVYKPQSDVKLNIEVSDDDKSPVKTELTLFAVDEGVLSLSGYQTPDPFSEFYGPRPLAFITSDSRLHIIGQRNFGEKGENRGGSGGNVMRLDGVDLRSKFVPTAYFNPSVITSSDGKAEVSFKLPDNLSKFRIMAVANSVSMFGSNSTDITVKKTLMLKPQLPRFLRVGDSFNGGVVVYNYTGSASTVTVSIEATGDSISFDGERIKKVFIENGKTADLLWSMKAYKAGKTSFKFKAVSDNDSDGLEWPLEVKLREKKETVVTSGVTEKEVVEGIKLSTKNISSADIEMTLSPSAFADVQEAARFLIEYPYGCLEQKLSGIMPIVVASDFVSRYKLGNIDDMKDAVKNVLDNLYLYQHPSGGFGYWKNPFLPDFYITAYALETAYLARREGYSVSDDALKKAVNWLKENLIEKKNWSYPYSESEEYASRAYAIYVLSLYGESFPSYFSQLYERRHQLPYIAYGYMIKAANHMGVDSGMMDTLIKEIMNQSRVAPQTMHFEEPSSSVISWIHLTNVKTTSIILESILESGRDMNDLHKVIRWLINERRIEGRWRTTDENAHVLRAFASFYKKYESINPDFKAEVLNEINGSFDPLWDISFYGRELKTEKKSFTPDQIFKDSNESRIKFAKTGSGRLYYTLRENYYPLKYDKPVYEGFEIEKSIKPLSGGSDIVVGRRYVVTIKLKTNQDRSFVVVDDPLPAGLEVVNKSFGVESSVADRINGDNLYSDYWGGFNHTELYDDRILLFSDYLTAGEHTYKYVVQAISAGSFDMPASWVSGMYEPEVFGRTASSSLEIK